jgi:hypothetical protein
VSRRLFYKDAPTMNFKHLIAGAALAAAFTGPALAVTFEGSLTQGATVVNDYAGPGLISFDIDFANFLPAVVEYRIDGGDVAAPIDFNAIFRNLSGSGITGFTIALSQGSFGTLGSVIRQFDGTASVSGGGQLATISFNSPEFLDVEIGNALGTTPNAADWTITGLNVGDRVSLTVTPVPEPTSLAMMFGGLALTGLWMRNQRRI